MKHFLRLLIILICYFGTTTQNEIFAQKNVERISWWAKKVDSTGLNNLYKLNDSIYRSEQPDSIAFANLKKIGIKSILNITTQQNDTAIPGNQDFNFYFVRMKAERFSDSDIINALTVIRNAPKPILIHCRHGSDRTGVVIAMYRIIYENHTKQEALDELRNGGYGFNTIFVNIPKYIKKVNIAKLRDKLTKP